MYDKKQDQWQPPAKTRKGHKDRKTRPLIRGPVLCAMAPVQSAMCPAVCVREAESIPDSRLNSAVAEPIANGKPPSQD